MLGSLCSLLLISKLTPDPIGPCVFQYVLNDCNFSALHEDFIATWHMDVRTQVQCWIDMGPMGDANEFNDIFISFFDVQACTIASVKKHYIVLTSGLTTEGSSLLGER